MTPTLCSLDWGQQWALGVFLAIGVATVTIGGTWWVADVLRTISNHYKTGRHWW